jgi:hypothetical protein
MLPVLNRQLVCAVRTAASAATAAKPVAGTRVKTFEIYRYNPDNPSSKPTIQVIFHNRKMKQSDCFRNTMLIWIPADRWYLML